MLVSIKYKIYWGDFVQGDFVLGDFVLGGFCPGDFVLIPPSVDVAGVVQLDPEPFTDRSRRMVSMH